MVLEEVFKRNIVLDVPTHRYTDELNREYKSVTTVLGKYEKEFNKEFWAVWTALKNLGVGGLKPDPDRNRIFINGVPFTLEQLYMDKQLRLEAKKKNLHKEWESITARSCGRGNETHNYLEDNVNALYVQNKKSVEPVLSLTGQPTNTKFSYKILDENTLNSLPLKNKYPEIYKLLCNLINKGYTLYAEFRVYTEEYLVAGTIDLLAVRGKEFIIVDWKTNKDVMRFESGYYKKEMVQTDKGREYVKTNNFIVTDDKMLYPVNHLPKCKGSTYTLQLSMYAWILESYGFTWLASYLVHIRRTDEKDYEPQFYKLEYYKKEIDLILKHYQDGKGRQNNVGQN